MKLTLSTLLGLTLFSVVSALPASLRELSTSHLPKGAAKLAFDDDAGLVYAFDEYGKKLGVVDPLKSTRDVQNNAGTCSPLSAEDVKKLPKWTALTDKAKANWGGGSHDVRTNMEDYTDYPANLCTSDDVVLISVKDDPTCTKSHQVGHGELIGTEGEFVASNEHSESLQTSLTVTKSSSLGSSVTMSATVGIPEVVDVTVGLTTTMEVTNTQSRGTTKSDSNGQSQSVSMKNVAGKMCKLEFNTSTCVVRGSGNIKFVASGWVWFAYDDKASSAVDGHYFWALDIASVIPKEEDRSSTLEVAAVVDVQSISDYHGTCVDV